MANKAIATIVEQMTAKKMADETVAKKAADIAKLNVDVTRGGTQIVLPEGMPTEDAIIALARRVEMEDSKLSIHEEVEGFPLDGAYALMKALQRIYGWAEPRPTPGWFGSMNPPTMVNLEIAHGVHTQIIWGGFAVPGISGQLQTGISNNNQGRVVFTIQGVVKHKDREAVQRIAELTRQIVREESIYRHSAFRLQLNEEGNVDANNSPTFLDLSKTVPGELVFNPAVNEQIVTSLFTPITHSDECRQHKIPLKRGILLSGPYGVGKTETAKQVAKLCTENGWTFIMLDRVSALKQALLFARQYEPAVVFAEDIDQCLKGEERTVDIDAFLNTIDGVTSKGSEIMTILTTNHIEKINQAMLRPGRLDAIIQVTPPDAAGVEKLMRLYGREILDADADLSEAAGIMAGEIPAFIREVVERAKLSAISRSTDGRLMLDGKDLAIAARSLKEHLELMKPRKADPLSEGDKLGAALSAIIVPQVGKKIAEDNSKHFKLIEDINASVN
jgi:transitional endoplasmic reticulum ATPase